MASLLTSSVTTVENVVVVPMAVVGWNVPLPLPCRIITSGTECRPQSATSTLPSRLKSAATTF